MMKNILYSAILALGLLSLSGCYDTGSSADTAAKTTKSKCGDGKAATAEKCGDGKCGDAKPKPESKCGAGKCGSDK